MVELSVVLPCRNEEQALEHCITQIKNVFSKHHIDGEIIVSDSSTDNSPQIATKLGVRLIKHDKPGYGRAYLEALPHAKGNYILIGDADATYDFRHIPTFLKALRDGYEFIIGDRMVQNLTKSQMPTLHRIIGNPLLSANFRLLFGKNIRDLHCGMRAFSKDSLDKMQLQTTGMEFATEMVLRAIQCKLRITQIPIRYHPRKGTSKLRSFSDGWRHLRFVMLYAPISFYFIPGLLLISLATLVFMTLSQGPVNIAGITLYARPLFGALFLLTTGTYICMLGLISKAYLKSKRLIAEHYFLDTLAKIMSFEKAILICTTIIIVPLIYSSYQVIMWIANGFTSITSNMLFVALSISLFGIQLAFTTLLVSTMLVETK